MSNAWMSGLENKQVILFDYPAMFEMGRFPILDELVEICMARDIQIVISSSFHFYHICVMHANSIVDKVLVHQTEVFIDKLTSAGLLHIDESMSLSAAFSSYSNDKKVSLMTGKNAPILHQFRTKQEFFDMSLYVFDRDNVVIYPDILSFCQTESNMSVNSVTHSTDYLDVSTYCNVGDTVFTSDGNEVVLTVKINTGAEGLVFRTKDPKVVAKIYHRGVLTPLRWMKLVRMTSTGLRAKGICWPSHLIYNGNKEPVGFIMPAAEGHTLGNVFDGPDAMIDRFPDWDRLCVTQAASQVLERILYLHLHGILIGDLQLKNIMIKSPSEIYLIDMDSVQLEDFPCPVGTEDFTPPELWDHSFSSFLRKPVHEDYSCGILVFSMLFCGQHPYNQRQGHETLREEIASHAFPYSMRKEEDTGIPLGGYDKIWEAITQDVQSLFCRAFSDGERFESVEWYAALITYRDQLAAKKIEDPQSYFLFPYLSREVPVPDDVRTNYKKSIRDSIIHTSDFSVSNNEKIMETPDRVMYNGKRIGVAFVNQDKLMQLEKVENEKVDHSTNGLKASAELSASINQTNRSSSDYGRTNKSTITEPLRVHRIVQKSHYFSNRVRIILAIMIFLLLVIFALLYTFQS